MNIFVLLTQKLAALAVMISAMEYLILRKQFGASGVWSWSVVEREFTHYPLLVRGGLRLFLEDQVIVLHFLLRLILAGALLFSNEHSPITLALLWLSTVLIAVRMRGTFNGGSDVMTAVVLGCLILGNTKFGIYYLAVQWTGSYVVAGAVKLANKEWRNGKALPHFMRARAYGAPEWAKRLCTSQYLSFSISWMIILFECSFPLVFVSREICIVYLCLGVGFHLVNFFVLGLNRFFWIWIAGYPVIYFLSH